MSAAATWSGVGVIVVCAATGDVLQSRAMKELGDLGAIRRSQGLGEVVRRVFACKKFFLGLLFMALAFFATLVTLSWAEVSVVGPSAASLTFIANALAARLFLQERVDAKRWLAAVFVAAGVAFLAR